MKPDEKNMSGEWWRLPRSRTAGPVHPTSQARQAGASWGPVVEMVNEETRLAAGGAPVRCGRGPVEMLRNAPRQGGAVSWAAVVAAINAETAYASAGRSILSRLGISAGLLTEDLIAIADGDLKAALAGDNITASRKLRDAGSKPFGTALPWSEIVMKVNKEGAAR